MLDSEAKGPHNTAAHWEDFVGDSGVAGLFSGSVDGSEDVEELPADGSVRLESQPVECKCDVVGRATGGEMQKQVS